VVKKGTFEFSIALVFLPCVPKLQRLVIRKFSIQGHNSHLPLGMVQETVILAVLGERSWFVCCPEKWKLLWWAGMALPKGDSEA
jgi:hypothetical protein